jgi:DNA-binding NtrC family response regulator
MTDAHDVMQRKLAGLLIGDSVAMRGVRALIRRVAPASLPVLIQGPTGSGKELVARALHLASGRQGGFVALNVCAIADSMFEDTLFGHVRGAFTGASGDSLGYLMEADRGTVFLDEISGLPLFAQAKLLRAIETKEFRPIGSRSDRRSDFRLVSASNEYLGEAVAGGTFREDLMFRLRGVVIEVPPLAARIEDIPMLARHFASRTVRGDEGPLSVSDEAAGALMCRDWPGNVRELKALIECAAALAHTGVIDASDVARAAELGVRERLTLASVRNGIAARHLLEVLEDTEWDVDATAAILGVHRATVYRRIGRLGPLARDAKSVRPVGATRRRLGNDGGLRQAVR